MINQTSNNFQNLTGTICCLNHGDSSARNLSFPEASSSNKGQESFQKNNLSDGFSGLQKNLGQQYSLDSQQSIQLITLLLTVLEEIMGNVSTNTGSSEVNANDTEATNSSTTTSESGDNNTATAEVSPDSCPYSG